MIRTTRSVDVRGQVMLFWDYDTQWGADRSRLPGGPKDWGYAEFENTERLLQLHADYDVPACFAVVGAAALPGERPYHDPAQIRRVHAAGHEIASHAMRHEWLPGLEWDALVRTLSESKDALEQCIGSEVTSFVPPYNQPFDFPRGLSFSLSERREAGPGRTDLARLCRALHEAGYQFCRVAYRPLPQRLAEWFYKQRLDNPSQAERIHDVTCIRVNTQGGFTTSAREQLDTVMHEGGIAVIYGHPHSLTAGNSQDEEHLVPLLEQIQQARQAGSLDICRPRDLISRLRREDESLSRWENRPARAGVG